jgi:hypothetical protein
VAVDRSQNHKRRIEISGSHRDCEDDYDQAYSLVERDCSGFFLTLSVAAYGETNEDADCTRYALACLLSMWPSCQFSC